MFSTFYNKISSIIDKHIPVKPLSKKERWFLSKPWITTGFRKSIYIKNNLYEKFLKSNSIYTRAKFKLYRNKLNQLLKIPKRKYYNNYFFENTNNSPLFDSLGLIKFFEIALFQIAILCTNFIMMCCLLLSILFLPR